MTPVVRRFTWSGAALAAERNSRRLRLYLEREEGDGSG